jgi:hypothetical protein
MRRIRQGRQLRFLPRHPCFPRNCRTSSADAVTTATDGTNYGAKRSSSFRRKPRRITILAGSMPETAYSRISKRGIEHGRGSEVQETPYRCLRRATEQVCHSNGIRNTTSPASRGLRHDGPEQTRNNEAAPSNAKPPPGSLGPRTRRHRLADDFRTMKRLHYLALGLAVALFLLGLIAGFTAGKAWH